MTLSRTMDTHVKSCGQRKVGSACLKCNCVYMYLYIVCECPYIFYSCVTDTCSSHISWSIKCWLQSVPELRKRTMINFALIVAKNSPAESYNNIGCQYRYSTL